MKFYIFKRKTSLENFHSIDQMNYRVYCDDSKDLYEQLKHQVDDWQYTKFKIGDCTSVYA